MQSHDDLLRVYEDDDLMVLAKPAGEVVNRSATAVGNTTQDKLAAYLHSMGLFALDEYDFPAQYAQLSHAASPDDIFGDPRALFVERSGLVHRLDKETSGVLLAAKHPAALVACMALFKSRQVEKTYRALAHGRFAEKQGTISAPIGRSSTNRHRFAVVADGRPARTKYVVTSEWQINPSSWQRVTKQRFGWGEREAERMLRLYQDFSLIECQPETGRTHQIRVHCAHLLHPLVADEVYSGKKRAKLDREWCPRHFLHASQLVFSHPRTGQKMEVVAPIPPELTAALDFLEEIASSQTH